MDLTSLSDDDLAAHHIAVVSEQERRQRLASIPEQIADLTTAATQTCYPRDPEPRSIRPQD